MSTTLIDLPKAKVDPAAVFDSPGEVLDHEGLSRADKVEILRVWEQDARRLAAATGESMAGGEPSRLDEVLRALSELGESGGPNQD